MTDNPQLDLDRDPTPAAESGAFLNPDEKADERAKSHEIELRNIALAEMQAQMGPIGKLIGSTESSKTIAFITALVCLLFMLLVFLMAFNQETGTISDTVWNLLSLLASIVTGCVGFVFGSKGD